VFFLVYLLPIKNFTYMPQNIEVAQYVSLATLFSQAQRDGDSEMTPNDMMAEIRDANLSYLMLAQQMIRADKATAIFRLGIAKEIADLIEGLNNSQILKLAGSNMMLARFRFEDSSILCMLTNYNKERALAHSHAAILMAGQAVEEIR
jgi:flagellar transcriptional activator FlhD